MQKVKTNSYEEQKRAQALKKSLAKKLERTEAEIAECEERARKLAESLEMSGADYEKAKSLYAEVEKNDGRLEELYALWEELSEQLSEAEMC